ncbi:MAG: hypothetical protein NWQ55_02035 [Salibacteraceae bacterium]|jgi:hypothetical protein|nr:hypothetical protein [Salibacteraceae bacterium]MDP4686417.1 hypothetical protein [Salibacteraceae bacterium]MDP4762235.1 hypothetical protein [Salibacteraceae bacterium]MDP4933275.1 hypothetical protein [Salibacteraceae bacterium]MDP4963821.1 hypothetical protein [Salibacteraceae bacterium]
MRKLTSYLAIIAIAFVTVSCQGFFGEKTDLSIIDAPEFQARNVAYVPIQPIISGFVSPTDVVIGFDELIYVVDSGAQEIIAYDQAGREQGRTTVPGVTKMVQDRQMNILAIGTFDTTINGSDYTLSTIYRLDLDGDAGYGIANAKVINKVVNPFYFKTSFSTLDAEVRFTSIDATGDNDYYVTRQGPRTNANAVGGADDGVILFDYTDEYVSNIFISTNSGFFRDYFKNPTCLVTYSKPRQGPSVSESRDFFVAMAEPSIPIKVQSIKFLESDFGSSYEVELLNFRDTAEADDFLYRPGRFTNPVDATLTGDGTNYLFVVDQAKDSIFQFTTKGLEGINPPAGSSEKKNIIASFGGTGVSATQFNQPSAVAYFNTILYVADRGNGRLLRFKLTTDFD